MHAITEIHGHHETTEKQAHSRVIVREYQI